MISIFCSVKPVIILNNIPVESNEYKQQSIKNLTNYSSTICKQYLKKEEIFSVAFNGGCSIPTQFCIQENVEWRNIQIVKHVI